MAMKTRKAWIAAILALVMILGITGCSGREPTAKELLAGVPTIEPEKYYDMTVEMEISAQASGQSSDISISLEAEGCGDVMHLYDMDMSLGVSGISIAFSMEAWMEKNAEAMYANMTMFGENSGWMSLSLESDSGTFPVESFQELIVNISSPGKSDAGLVLEPHEEGEDYVVTWTENGVDAGDLSGTFSSLFGSFAGSGQMAAADGLKMDSVTAQAWFDEETHDLKFIRIETDASSSGGEANVSITVAFHTVNSDPKQLSIPQNVIDTAVDVSGLLG